MLLQLTVDVGTHLMTGTQCVLVVNRRCGLAFDLLQIDGMGDCRVGQVGHLAGARPLQQLGREPARQLVAGRGEIATAVASALL